MNAHTPTFEIVQAYRGKTEILLAWEKQPIRIQEQNAEYLADLTKRIRTLSVYLSHRRDAPV